MDILEFFKYGFIQRALIAGAFISVLCAVLGVLLVLRRLALIGDGLAHVTFGSVALGLIFGVYPIYVALPVVILSSLGILKLMEKAKLFGDTSIGIISSLGVAFGILAASLAGGFNVDLFSFLFGNILSISLDEVYISIFLSLIVLLGIIFYYQEIFSITFNEELAQASGVNTKVINNMIVIFTAMTVVLTMKVVGIMLTSALLILPAVTAFQIARSFKGTLIIAALAALVAVVSGIFLSFLMNLPTGATIVLVNFILFVAAFVYKK